MYNPRYFDMSSSGSLPDAIQKIQHSLDPFVKERQEIDHIRRVLAVYLSQHVDPDRGELIPTPLSLVHTENAGISSSGFRGSRKEYVRCVRANVKARKEYAKISREHQLQSGPHFQRPREAKCGVQDAPTGSGTSLNLFLDLVRQKRKYERLSIIQDYLDTLAQKPAAAPDHLHPTLVLQDIDPMPQMPAEVLTIVGHGKESAIMDLKDFVDRLERSVLRAKLLLQREQKLLAKVRKNSTSSGNSCLGQGDRLQALGATRNELISWIETELGKAGDDNCISVDDSYQVSSGAIRGSNHIENQVALIGRQYNHYTKARQALILAVADQPASKTPKVVDGHQEDMEDEEQVESIKESTSHVTSHFLGTLLAVSNDQKSAIQQKSHLSISMAKQLKEAGQGLERLAHESHLLPMYPLTANFGRKGKEDPASFADEISRHEKPDSSRRARAWVYAAGRAQSATSDIILGNLEESEMATARARKTLSDLQTLLGADDTEGNEDGGRQRSGRDIWATLDGNLGVINRDEV